MNMNPMITMAQNSKTMQQKQNVQNGMSLMSGISGMLKGNMNPMMSAMSGGNSPLSEVMAYVNKNGGDAKACFYNLASQMGVDPEMIINQARTMMNGK